MPKPKVLIINGSWEYSQMFHSQGWECVDNMDDADLIQFTGGSDVSPNLYGEELHPTSRINSARDKKEQAVFKLAFVMGKPMAGICRGGQFLNVMCGGRMWQHVTGHATGKSHQAQDKVTGEWHEVTSTHHQMMNAGPGGDVFLVSRICPLKERMGPLGRIITVIPKDDDVEGVFYAKARALCFQPHPEFNGCHALRGFYFDCVKRYLEVGE